MNSFKTHALPLALLAALCPLPFHSAVAQDLRLFEPTGEEPAATPSPAGPGQAFNVANGQPAYTLRSLSRFGDHYQAVLINRAGEIAKVDWRAGENAPVTNSGGFTIVAAGPGTVSLMHPGGDSCVAAPAVGVACADGNRSELRLTAAPPLASNGIVPPMGPMGPQPANGGITPGDPLGLNGVQGQVNAQGQQVFINPFSGEPEVMPQISEEERIAREQRQELRAARLRQFEQGAQIPDAAVPPGMERVRTPFGDRLVPIRQ